MLFPPPWLPVSTFARCPKPSCAETLGWTLLDEGSATGQVRVAFIARPPPATRVGGWGGFLSAMLDDTLGPTVLVRTGGERTCATIDLHSQFIAPALPGPLIGEGRLVQLGRTVAFLEGEVRDPAGIVVSRATASARVVPTADSPYA